MEGETIIFEDLKPLSQGKIHEMTYPQEKLDAWKGGDISLLEKSSAPLFIKDFIGYKKRPESSRHKTPWYFGEAYVATQLAECTKEGWYNSFKWPYVSKWITGDIEDDFEARFYETALETHFGKTKLERLHRVCQEVEGFPSKPKAPDLWLVDNKGKHHFIEVKTWRWDSKGRRWIRDKPSASQLGGLALIHKFLENVEIYIVWLYPEDKKPSYSWQKHIDEFNELRRKLPQNL